MNIDMRNIPYEFEKNIREIMDNKNIPASKALIWALEDRKNLELKIERLIKQRNQIEREKEEMEIIVNAVKNFKKAINEI